MRTMQTLPVLLLAAALSACGSSGTAEPSSAASESAAPLATVVIVTPAAAVTCDDMALAAANLRTYVHYASLNVGTTNDSAPTYADMGKALGVMEAAAPDCVEDPIAVSDSLATLEATAQQAATAFRPGDAAADVAAQKEALTAMKDAGVAAWTAMGMDAGDWEMTLRFVE